MSQFKSLSVPIYVRSRGVSRIDQPNFLSSPTLLDLPVPSVLPCQVIATTISGNSNKSLTDRIDGVTNRIGKDLSMDVVKEWASGPAEIQHRLGGFP